MFFFYFFATLDGNDANLVVAMVFRVIKVLVDVVPFEITAGLDVRRKIDVERLTVVGCSVDVFIDVAALFIVRPPMPDIVRRTNGSFAEAFTGRSVLLDRTTFNRDVIAGEPTLLDGILLMLPRLARRFNVDVGARTKIKQTRKPTYK